MLPSLVVFADNELVIRGPGGVLARKRDERPADDGRALAAEDSFLVKCLGRQIPIRQPQIRHTVIGQVVIRFS